VSVDVWAGEFGNAYTERNKSNHFRKYMWHKILWSLPELPGSVLEVGANIGLNLDAIGGILPSCDLLGLEPNISARKQLAYKTVGDTAQEIHLGSRSVDMVFTCGVLIHIHPEELEKVCGEIYRVSDRYIVCIEYFSAKPEEIPYRGCTGLLWKRDFGGFWLDHFSLRTVDYGFFWKRETGLDNLTWWVFEKLGYD